MKKFRLKIILDFFSDLHKKKDVNDITTKRLLYIYLHFFSPGITFFSPGITFFNALNKKRFKVLNNSVCCGTKYKGKDDFVKKKKCNFKGTVLVELIPSDRQRFKGYRCEYDTCT